MFSFAAVLRVVWHSVAFSRSLLIDGELDAMDIPYRHHDNTSSGRIRRPPLVLSMNDETGTSHSTTTRGTSTRMQVQIPQNPKHLSSLCGTIVDTDARVLISGILSHPFGSELAMFLSKDCNVQRIVGISEHALDSEGYRRLAFLLRYLPNIEIHRTAAVDSGPASMDISRIFESLIPTHVIHLEETSFLPSSLQITPAMIAVRNSINKIERVCEAMVKQKASGMISPRMVYVSTPTVQGSDQLTMAIRDIYPMLMKTYRSKYDIQLAHLQLPTIHGPFSEVSYLMGSILNQSKNLTTTVNMPTELPASLIHISDSIYLTLNCLSRIKQSADNSLLPSFTAAKVHTHSLAALSSALRPNQAMNSSHSDRLLGQSHHMRSWYHKVAHLYDTSNGDNPRTQQAIRQTNSDIVEGFQNNRSIAGISQIERRNFQLFPCSSECATPHTQCSNSSFDESVHTVTRNSTYDCRYVIYTTDFSSSLKDLPALRNATDQNVAWPSHLVCQVAFVSSNSKLVSKLIHHEESKTDQLEMSYWNGKLTHNRWRLVWASPEEELPLSEADYMMPKIVPGNFFSHNVTTALYMEVKHIDPLPSLPILWYLMAKQLHQKGIPGRDKVVRRSGTSVESTIHIPGLPARHIALFSHWAHTRRHASAGTMAKYVLDQKGVGWDRQWPNQQMEFLDFAWKDFDIHLPDTFLLVHNIQSERSRRLRCEWYEEQLFWSDKEARNRDLEDMTLAFVLARLRMEHRLVAFDDAWGERLLSSDELTRIADAEDMSSQYFVKHHKAMKVRRSYDIDR